MVEVKLMKKMNTRWVIRNCTRGEYLNKGGKWSKLDPERSIIFHSEESAWAHIKASRTNRSWSHLLPVRVQLLRVC